MSIQSEIERISSNVASAYDAVREKGGAIPEKQNSNNLAAAIQEIPTIGGVTSFNGRTGEVVSGVGDYTADMVGARPDTWTPSALQIPFSSSKVSAKNVQSAIEEVASSSSDGEVFSSTETVVGTWLGETIYRKVVTIALPSAIDTIKSTNVLSSPCVIRNFYGYIESDDGYMLALNAANTSYGVYILCSIGNSGRSVELATNMNNLLNRTATIVVEYTK